MGSPSPGQVIWVTVSKANGQLHRRWQACIERVAEDCLVTVAGVGNPVILSGRTALQKYPLRSFYWIGRRYDLLEVYDPDGRLHELYSNICSPIEWTGDGIRYTDHELDIVQYVGREAEIVDEDEFAAAAAEFGYSDEFQRLCYAAAAEALDTVRTWQPRGFNGGFKRCP
ncbi:MAG: DUF402 domain-containing protein [Chloroflexota bacterium]